MFTALWLLLLLFSYLGYPLLMRILSQRKSLNQFEYYESKEDLPHLSILMPIHNEDAVLEEKLESIFENIYDFEKIKIFIGLDDCTDNSLQIVKQFQDQYPGIISYVSTLRIGKPEMLNLLYEQCKTRSGLLVFTDANVFFMRDTLYELSKYFKDIRVGLVDTKYYLSKDIISHEQENDYLSYELKLKYQEGVVWGVMQGPFGGCFVIRKELFEKIPPKFLVDDFFIGMNVMKKGYYSIQNPAAVVLENVNTTWQEEFKRKKRIAIGNFQNLNYFSFIFSKPFTALCTSWFFHKVIRWLLPVLIIPSILIDYVLAFWFPLNIWPVTITLILIIVILWLQYVLQRVTLQSKTITRLSYFIYVNIALLSGFFIYLKGIKSNVWEPTNRK